MICDETNNTPEDIAAGKLTVDIETVPVTIELEDGSESFLELPLAEAMELMTFVEKLREDEAKLVGIPNL